MKEKRLLGIELPDKKREDILEEILKCARNRATFCHVMSLNPEIFVQMHDHPEFKEVVKSAQIKIIDGVGVVLAARALGIRTQERLTGVDMTDEVLKQAAKGSLTVMLIGGKGNVAERVSDCYSRKYPNLDVLGIQGISDITRPTPAEEDKIFSIVADRKPHIIFTAFGSPHQELWMYRHREKLKGIVCAGVGGTFDFLAGDIPRAPRIFQVLGLEWFFRLVQQPWRWKRQLRIFRFLWLVLLQKLGKGSRLA